MLQVNGITIDKLPFEGVEFINELLNFEGSPTLVHLRDYKKMDILSYWVDFDNNGSRWLHSKVSKKELFLYLAGIKSLRDFFSDLSSDYFFLVDTNSEGEISSVLLIEPSKLPEQYRPKQNSYYRKGLSDFYSEYLTEYSYIHRLRENSYIIKVEPTLRTHSKTVGAKEAATVLNGVANSIEGFIRVKAFNLLKDKFADTARINRRINKVKNYLSPRITETQYNSFEVWLAIDVITFDSEDKIDTELRNNIVEGYRQDVLDVDFSSEQDATLITQKYNHEERKLIFEPLFKIFEDDDYKISISDYAKKMGRLEKQVKVTTSFKEIILPKPTVAEVQAELEKKNKIVAFVYNLKEGQDLTKISKKKLMENLIFQEEWAESPFDIQSPIEVNGVVVEMKKPLRCTMKVNAAGNLQIYHSALEIFSEGNDIVDVTADVKKQFLSLAHYLLANPDWIDSKADELRKYL